MQLYFINLWRLHLNLLVSQRIKFGYIVIFQWNMIFKKYNHDIQNWPLHINKKIEIIHTILCIKREKVFNICYCFHNLFNTFPNIFFSINYCFVPKILVLNSCYQKTEKMSKKVAHLPFVCFKLFLILIEFLNNLGEFESDTKWSGCCCP